jgi:selenocysteine-specific elongation factor
MPASQLGSRPQFVICLAGHIDHGKSCLVHALTGGSVDRLPEEKRRGITIDLGFSHFDADNCRVALIDVPGHERFVHTMVAGASGVDLALLVVAADDSVMPQTREHLSLLELLKVQRGVIAITKCDLADDEQLKLVDLEIDELVGPSFLADALRIRVSAQTGLGIAELRQALVDGLQLSRTRPTADARFRLPIDRAFSPAGQGAVVTGTVWRGVARVGDMLHLLPEATPVRIRRLQAQGVDVEQVSAGERAAINLAGIKASAIHRGDELATPHTFEPGCRHLVQLRILADAATGLRHRQFVRMHLGANQATAQVLMDEREVVPGKDAFAVLRCKTPIVAEYGQPFVLRQLSPAATLGGGTILAPALRPIDKFSHCLAVASGLSDADPYVRLAAYVELRGEAGIDASIESSIGLSPQQCEAVAQRLVERREIIRSAGPRPCFVTARRVRQIQQQMLRRCQIELDRRRPASQVPVSVVMSAMSRYASPPVLEALLDDMTARRELVRRGDRVGLPTGAALSHRQRQMLDALLAECAVAGPTPPTLKEFAERHGYHLRDLEPLVQVAVDEGRLVRLSPALVIDREAIENLRQRLVEHFERHMTAKVGEIREQWSITRKHAVPIFEFFDECQITSRAGDLRSAGPRLSLPVNEALT